jgi:MFS family permease
VTARLHRFAFPLLAYAFAAMMLGTTIPTPLYALFGQEEHFAVLTTTVIYATYAGGVLFALLAFGRWSDAVGRRPMLSAGIFTGTATAAVIEAAPPRWRGRAAAVATVANIGGLGAGPLLAGLLAQYAPMPLDLVFVVHIVMAIVAGVAVFIAPETSERAGTLGLQRLSVPPEVRSTFVIAALAAFAGFSVTGLFTAVAPSFLANVIGVTNHAAAGAMPFSIFGASAVAQIFATRIRPQRAVAVGSAILVVGMVILALALHFSSLPGLIAAAVVAGVGQGMSFSRGLAAVVELTPAQRRAEVSSTYFVVAYVAISLPVVGEGLAAQAVGLRTAGVSFAIAVAVLAVLCLAAILWRERVSPEEA